MERLDIAVGRAPIFQCPLFLTVGAAVLFALYIVLLHLISLEGVND
jgi:hypothetical protein